jgi:broad specificity phosphatase PhoE
MTRFLYVVRHGTTDPHDGPLSEAGREQAQLTGQRLRDVPFAGIWHGPLPRVAQTAALIAERLPGVPVTESDLAGDYLPSAPDPDGLPPSYAEFIARFSAAERTEGPARAAAALARFAAPPPDDQDRYELLVTHNFLIGWLVSQAVNGPSWRWLGLNQMNCAVTIIAYQSALPPSLILFNDASHLPPTLRWIGFPPTLRPTAT